MPNQFVLTLSLFGRLLYGLEHFVSGLTTKTTDEVKLVGR